MKDKILRIVTIIFFIVVNTRYFWVVKLDFYNLPVFIALFLIFLGLNITLITQIYFLVKKKSKSNYINILLLSVVIILTFIYPSGIIDYEKFESKNILTAEIEGAANCTITFQLKENLKFKEKTVCFGVSEIVGDYYIKNDTIFFKNVNSQSNKDKYYSFALIQASKYRKNGNNFDLRFFKSFSDTTGNLLWITKNKLKKHKKIK
jgi:hypothetical protein